MEKLSYWWNFREGKESTIVIIMAFVIGSVGFLLASQPEEPSNRTSQEYHLGKPTKQITQQYQPR